eukprot:TRINITY_DN27867_c0_g1_i1.p1 TRINITY_DN27867_c0_g1~~TRINITY_DN27867_c0_g1_i1.p1  ORF type:complete len:123 (-),score=24.05 TRINITY_DN27867_c0_g1_i1:131-499(-)
MLEFDSTIEDVDDLQSYYSPKMNFHVMKRWCCYHAYCLGCEWDHVIVLFLSSFCILLGIIILSIGLVSQQSSPPPSTTPVLVAVGAGFTGVFGFVCCLYGMWMLTIKCFLRRPRSPPPSETT